MKTAEAMAQTVTSLVAIILMLLGARMFFDIIVSMP
jgi:hypothetical protein